MTTTGQHIEDALTALRAMPDAPLVRVNGDATPLPDDLAAIIIVRLVTATPDRDYEAEGRNPTVQVDTYGATVAQAVDWAERAMNAMESAGFAFKTERQAPVAPGERLRGWSIDYER